MEYARVARVTHPDADLVDRCRARDESAFQEIVGRYKHKLYNYIYRMTGNVDDAEDLTQEVFVRLYVSLDSFRSQSSLSTWLFRIASNLCIDRFRRAKKHRAVAFSLDEPISGDYGEDVDSVREVADLTYEPLRAYQRQEMNDRIEAALMAMPEKLRAVVILYDVEGLAYEEIAQIVGCPLGTVKSRLFNGRMNLRKSLARYLRDE